VKKTDIVYDSGAGWPNVLPPKDFGCSWLGIDINPVRISEAKENAKRPAWRPGPIRKNDLFQADIHDASGRDGLFLAAGDH